MSEPSVVVLPASGGGPHQEQETAEIASTVQQALYERRHPEPEQSGPFKQILANPDSFYKYINWEDPIRTLATYLGATSILFGAHYLPLTQMALKAGVTTLGAVSVTEFCSRSFSGNSLSARLRPREYKTIPEPTLNATLKDIHDLIQYTVVQAQRIVFGQDLDRTFASFLGFFVLFWLTKMVPLFWFNVMVLTLIFVAPLISSEQGRRAAHDASMRAQELGHDGQVKAAELSSKGKQTAADLSAQTRDATSGMFDTATDNIKSLSQKGKNAANETQSIASSTYGNAKRYISDPSAPPSNHTNGHSDGSRSTVNGVSNELSHLANSASETSKRTAPGANTSKQFDSDRQQYPVSSLSAYTSSMDTETTNGTTRRVHTDTQPDLVHQQHPVSYLPVQADNVRIGAVTDKGLR